VLLHSTNRRIAKDTGVKQQHNGISVKRHLSQCGQGTIVILKCSEDDIVSTTHSFRNTA
jgi:hypothetical protein